MKCVYLPLVLLSLFVAEVHSAASVSFVNGISNMSLVTGNSWVYLPSPPYPESTPSGMFRDVIRDYGGSPSGVSGASADSQVGFSIFGGAGFDITKLSWEIGVVGGNDTDAAMTLYTGAGSATLSPGVASEGKEDYRYDDVGGTAAKNLVFYYDNGAGAEEWVSGYITRFVTTVTDIAANDATAIGEVTITDFTLAGTAFYNEIMALSGGTGAIEYVADSFSPVLLNDPGTFSSTGSFTVVPEPSTGAALLGVVALVLVVGRRRKV